MYTLCNNFNIFNILYRIAIQLQARVLNSVLKFSTLSKIVILRLMDLLGQFKDVLPNTGV